MAVSRDVIEARSRFKYLLSRVDHTVMLWGHQCKQWEDVETRAEEMAPLLVSAFKLLKSLVGDEAFRTFTEGGAK